MGLSTLLQLLLKLSVNRLAPGQRHWRAETLAIRFLGTLVAAWSSFQILQTSGQIIPTSTGFQKAKSEARQISAGTCIDNDQESAANRCPKRPAAIAGRTIDLSMFPSSFDNAFHVEKSPSLLRRLLPCAMFFFAHVQLSLIVNDL